MGADSLPEEKTTEVARWIEIVTILLPCPHVTIGQVTAFVAELARVRVTGAGPNSGEFGYVIKS
jgi:hypothetical protein